MLTLTPSIAPWRQLVKMPWLVWIESRKIISKFILILILIWWAKSRVSEINLGKRSSILLMHRKHRDLVSMRYHQVLFREGEWTISSKMLLKEKDSHQKDHQKLKPTQYFLRNWISWLIDNKKSSNLLLTRLVLELLQGSSISQVFIWDSKARKECKIYLFLPFHLDFWHRYWNSIWERKIKKRDQMLSSSHRYLMIGLLSSN